MFRWPRRHFTKTVKQKSIKMSLKLFGILYISILLHGLIFSTPLPLVINTWPFENATKGAWNALKFSNANAVTAVVAGCEVCEREQCDRTVGFGGSPDENGETTLDALIFDGATMKAGAVAQLRNCKQAIRTAYSVLRHAKHTLLAGSLATEFAHQMGCKIESLSTNQSMDIHNTWKAGNCQPNFWMNVIPNPTTSCGPYTPAGESKIEPSVIQVEFSRYNHDTIGMIVLTNDGHIAAGTSTNGATHKIPGRVGDSPIPGSGAYASNEFGAATCTGDGDVLMRFSPAALAVNYMEVGLSPDEAAQKVIEKINTYYPGVFAAIVVVNPSGDYAAACSGMNEFQYSVISGDSGEVQIVAKKCLV